MGCMYFVSDLVSFGHDVVGPPALFLSGLLASSPFVPAGCFGSSHRSVHTARPPPDLPRSAERLSPRVCFAVVAGLQHPNRGYVPTAPCLYNLGSR